MRLGKFIEAATEKMRSAGHSSPLTEVQYLAAGVLGLSRVEVMYEDQKDLSQEAVARLEAALARRAKGEPLAYILGYKDFYKARFKVGRGVLVPRPETEHLVEEALKRLGTDRPKRHILDIGCGSGCIGLSLLLEWPSAKLIAVDKGAEAIKFTSENINDLGLEKRATAIHEELSNFVRQCPAQFELIVANPPYIARDDARVEPGVREHEPPEALFADEEGMAMIWQWLDSGGRLLKPEGWFLMEIGAGQAQKIREQFERRLPNLKLVDFQDDLAGNERVLICRRFGAD